jgi:hypothetical protein
VKPLARRDDMVIRELPGELVVYDRREHRAHCLNATAAQVFRTADGSRGVGELAAGLDPAVAPELREALVREALEQLAAAGLLTAAEEGEPGSRRELLRRLGGAAALLVPAVVSVLAPTPAEAASCLTSCPPAAESQPCQCLVVPQPDCGTCQIDGTCAGAGGGPC